MVRIVRLALEEGVAVPPEMHEIEWPEVALRKQREKPQGKHAAPLDPVPQRRRGRPRKITPQVEWPVAENPAPENSIPQPFRESGSAEG